jgi:hypothetical protein
MIILLTYDRSRGVLLDERQFDDARIGAANDARLEAELQCAHQPQIEIVIHHCRVA